ncbi:MAG: hypothetical protein H0T53_07660 [Herpetosiphonaceae bacterium]|nr:hypothetical protein [Herpetosiphonaceae bacterium]
MSRSRKPPPRQRLALFAPLLAVLILGVGILFFMNRSPESTPEVATPAANSAAIEIPHIHGIGFSGDGQTVVVAAHEGTRTLTNGVWQIPAGPAHDYMGFTASDDGFYSSGHPAIGSPLPNPLGLLKSTDGGATVINLTALGERDFHVMGVGYSSHIIYVFNPSPTGSIPAGIAVSRDDGKTWAAAPVSGLTTVPNAIAVHPTDARIVAFATNDGMWLSTDGGQSVSRLPYSAATTAATFSVQDGRLWYGGNDLAVYDLATQTRTAVALPSPQGSHTLGAIAVNPVQANDIVIGTYERNIYRSADSGGTWAPLAQSGRAVAARP